MEMIKFSLNIQKYTEKNKIYFNKFAKQTKKARTFKLKNLSKFLNPQTVKRIL